MILIISETTENEQQNTKQQNVNMQANGDYIEIFNELYSFHDAVLKNADLKYIWNHVVSKRVHEGKEIL